MKTNILDRLSFLSLFLVVVLLPVFCLPFTNIPVEISKGLLLTLGLAACIIFWAIARFLDGRIIFPKSWLLVSGFGIVLVFLLGSIFSSSPQVSLFGTMFDVGSFWFIFGGFILMLCSSIVFRTPERAKIVLLGTILSSALVFIFQSVHLFMPTILSLGILTGKTSNIFGSWNALGLFAGFSGLLFLLVVEFFPISKLEKIFLEILILLSMLLMAAVNFPLVWILLGISSLIIFVYKVSLTFHKKAETETSEGEKRYFPTVSFIVVMVALLFFLSGQFVGNFIPNRLQISNAEINPSFGATLSITKEALRKHPLFGIGPNRFGEAWAMYKPAVINNTQFWDVSFNSGSGLLPTLVSTTGSLGFLAWLVFLILFLTIGVKSIFSSIKNETNWEMMAFFVLSLYLFVSSFFYSVGAVIFLLAFALTGVFIGLSVSSRPGGEISLSFLDDYRKSFFSILLMIFIIVISVAVSFKYIERFTSVFYFNKALTAPTVPEAITSISKALTLYENDLYLRTYAQIYLVKLDSLAKKGASLSETEKADLQTALDQAVSGAQMATAFNGANYLNFQALGSLYQSLASFGVKDVYSKAIEAYKIASILNPKNPGLKLALAGASFANGKVQDANDFANAALTLKPDYVDALITLSQIAKSKGNDALALSYAEQALSILPANSDLIKYVDSLKKGTDISTPTVIPKKP